MKQISQVLIRKIEITIEMFNVNKLSQGRGELDGMIRSTLHNCFNLTIEEIDNMDLDKRRVIFLMLPEVVGSTPTTRSIS
jgi:uncharacterized protein YlxP (DUF503 family)